MGERFLRKNFPPLRSFLSSENHVMTPLLLCILESLIKIFIALKKMLKWGMLFV